MLGQISLQISSCYSPVGSSPVGSARAKQGILYNCPFQGAITRLRQARPSPRARLRYKMWVFCASARRGVSPRPWGYLARPGLESLPPALSALGG